MAFPILRTPDCEYDPVPLPPSTTQQSKGDIKSKTLQVGTSSVAQSLTEKTREPTAQRPGWTSTYLQKSTLLGFAVAYLCFLLAVIALAIVDAKQDGIANAKSSEHYLWTYGPTAVLAIVAALWNQVEYRTKHAMPWVLLQKGPTPTSKTLLMDYITPSKLEVLIASLRSSHWPVVIAIANSFLITLLTVASTGLLVLQSTPFVRHDCRLNVTDDFVTSFDPFAIGSASVLATIAVQDGTIPFPPGTSHNAAFQTLFPPASLSGFGDIEVEGLTSSFYAGLDCEIATIKSGASGCNGMQCRGLNVTLDITSPTCDIKDYNLTTSCGMGLNAISCDVNTAWGVGCDSYADGHDKNRLVFMVGQLYQDLGKASRNGTNPLEVVAANTTTIVCEPKYNITDTIVMMDQDGNLKDTLRRPAITNHTQQFPAWDLIDGLRTASDAAGAVLNNTYSYGSTNFFPWLSFHTLFIRSVGMTHPLSDLKDPSVLQLRVDEVFSMATAQMAKQSLMRASTDVTIGTCYGTKDRLRIRGLSLYLMGAVLILLIMSTMCLLYIAPRKYSSRDPSSIGGLALVLSQSPALLSRFSPYGAADVKSMKSHLENIECQTMLTQDGQNWRFAVDLASNGTLEAINAAPETTNSGEITYWRPLSLRPVFKILVIAAILVLVVVLEVLYWVSRKQNGLAEVNPLRYERFSWVYVPAIVMLTAQTLVGMIAFSTLMVFPYFRLRKQASNTRSDILRNYVSETAIKCLWQAISAKHVIVLCMALAMLMTPLLTIAVSGLYTAQATSVQIPVTLAVQNQLNSSFLPTDLPMTGNYDLSVAANSIGLLLTQNFTYPLWTYDELAFPGAVVKFPGTVPSNSSVLHGSNITATLPGIRSSLNCSVAPSFPKNFSDIIGGFAYRKANVTAFEAAGVYDDQTNIPWPSPGLQPFGFFSICRDGFYAPMKNQFCGAFGTSEVDWKAFTCSSSMYELDVEITMDASTLAILAASPHERTSRLFSKQPLIPATFSDFPSGMVPSLFGTANFAHEKPVGGYYDPIFQAVVYGLDTRDTLDNFPMAEYMDDDGFEIISARLQHVHRTITAQSTDIIRIPLDSTSPNAPSPTVNATLTNPHVYRLQQSAVSTRILDGLLVAIALCIALSFGLMDTRKILPKNPASIAAGASLIARDSQMLRTDVLPEGAQWYSDAELKAKKVWDDLVFKLGWWDSNRPREEEERGTYFKLDSMFRVR